MSARARERAEGGSVNSEAAAPDREPCLTAHWEATTFRWYQSTRNHYVARFGKHGSIEVVRPQKHDPRTHRPRPWRVLVFGSHLLGGYEDLERAKQVAEREAVMEVVRLAEYVGVRVDDGAST